MLALFIEKLLGLNPENAVKKLYPVLARIDEFEESLINKEDEYFSSRINELKLYVQREVNNSKKLQKILDDILPETFALVREASKRVLSMRHFPVQLLGGMILHQGNIAEMRTGEGKTLVATCPAVLNALSGKDVHIITVNDYLAKRDSEWMGKIYKFLGLSVGLIYSNQPSKEKKQAYLSDIVYGTNNEYGFDYLRDNMAESSISQVRRGFYYAIIDEVDSVLIDEARTPLIISGSPEQSKTEVYLVMEKVSKKLQKGENKDDLKCDYYLDEKSKNVILTDKGIKNAENLLGVKNLWDIESNLAHHLLQGLKAKEFFKRDSEYVVQINPETNKKEVIIVDEFTGRLMNGRRWSDGLHQAVEAKENVPIQEETLTLASITFQNFFRLYEKLSGMTGTALTEAEEFKKIYNLPVMPIPTNQTNIRKDLNDQVYKNQKQKFFAILEEIIDIHKTGKPILVGTTSIDKSELLSEMLTKPQAAFELLTYRANRLLNLLEKNQSLDADKILIKELKKALDKPLNIKFELVYNTFKEASKNNSIKEELRKALEETVKSQNITNKDNELVFYLKSFLKSCEILETIKKGVKHNILNAKYHEEEAQIIAQAGKLNALTIATNMAGRGTDILLGGNPETKAIEKIKHLNFATDSLEYKAAFNEELQKIKAETDKEHEQVVKLGGLHIIGTERHESRRIDNQLRGRAARQGDPGSTRFFLGLDDSLMRIFGGDKLLGTMDMLKADEDIAIEAGLINKGIENAQKKVEAHNYEIRKRLLEYDNVQDTQRKVIYEERQKILEGCDMKDIFRKILKEQLENIIYTFLDPEKSPDFWFEKVNPDKLSYAIDEDSEENSNVDEKKLPTNLDLLLDNLKLEFPVIFRDADLTPKDFEDLSFSDLAERLNEIALEGLKKKEDELDELLLEAQRHVFLKSIDDHWVQHLQALDALKEGIHLRGYGNKQPLVEYKTEALALFDNMINSIRKQALQWIFHVHKA